VRQSLTAKNLKKIDKSGMLDLLLDFPLQCRAALNIAASVKLLFERRDFGKIVFFGMGGSAIGADLARSYLYFGCRNPLCVLREYEVPGYVDSSTLAFVSSYSGNTKETLNAYREVKEKGASIIAISSDGALRDYASRDGVTFVQLPAGLPPRAAFGYSSIIPLCILAKLGLIEDLSASINQMADLLEGLRNNNLNPNIPQKDNIAKSIALKLYNKFVVIYSGSLYFDICVTRLRSQLAENAKALSSSHLFPEVIHNEVVGWQNPGKIIKNFAVVLLRDKDMHPYVAKAMDLVKEILNKEENIDMIEIWSRGEGILSRIFSLIYIGDFISFYLAALYGVDPFPTEKITYIKEQLKKVHSP